MYLQKDTTHELKCSACGPRQTPKSVQAPSQGTHQSFCAQEEDRQMRKGERNRERNLAPGRKRPPGLPGRGRRCGPGGGLHGPTSRISNWFFARVVPSQIGAPCCDAPLRAVHGTKVGAGRRSFASDAQTRCLDRSRLPSAGLAGARPGPAGLTSALPGPSLLLPGFLQPLVAAGDGAVHRGCCVGGPERLVAPALRRQTGGLRLYPAACAGLKPHAHTRQPHPHRPVAKWEVAST